MPINSVVIRIMIRIKDFFFKWLLWLSLLPWQYEYLLLLAFLLLSPPRQWCIWKLPVKTLGYLKVILKWEYFYGISDSITLAEVCAIWVLLVIFIIIILLSLLLLALLSIRPHHYNNHWHYHCYYYSNYHYSCCCYYYYYYCFFFIINIVIIITVVSNNVDLDYLFGNPCGSQLFAITLSISSLQFVHPSF